MAGPGGGSSGGGFGGGGSRGGGGFGGGFGGGGYRHHYHRPGFFFWGPRRYYGGGCLGGLLGMVFLPIIVCILAVVFLISSVISAFSIAAQGGIVTYNESVFQDYTNDAYNSTYGQYAGFEDNILIVFTTDEKNENYYCIGWVGDHVVREINYMFGNEQTAFGRAITSSVNEQNYKYSLDSNLADAVMSLADEIDRMNVAAAHTCKENQDAPSRLINRSELDLSVSEVEEALNYFRDKTNIPISIVVDEEEDVFGKRMPIGVILTIIISIVIIAICAFSIFKAFKYRNGGPRDNNMFDDNNFG